MDERELKNYQRRIAHAAAKIDNKPPKFKVSIYYKSRKLEVDAARVKELDKENMELLKKINIINRLGGSIDCWLKHVTYKSNLENQEAENKRIIKTNKKLLKKINEATSQYSAAYFLKSWKDMKDKSLITRGHLGKQEYTASETNKDYIMVKSLSVLKSMNPEIRTRCFFEIEMKETKQNLGKIIFELYDDVVPRTAANFAELCRGTKGLSYKGTPFHRIVKGYWCQGGDVTKFNGTGGASIYDAKFQNENFSLCHAAPGVLSMCYENGNDSKFNLTFKRLESQDGLNVVFGRVVFGLGNIYKVEEFGTKTGKPIKSIIVSNCGICPKKQKTKFRKSRNNKFD